MKRKLMAATLAVSMAASMAVPAVSFAEEATTEAAVEATAETPEVKRAILDTDMSYLNDDAIVMFMLLLLQLPLLTPLQQRTLPELPLMLPYSLLKSLP